MIFHFGKENVERIEAKSLEVAIKLFKISILFPEKYVSDEYVENKEYISAEGRYEYTFKPNPQIPVYDDNDKKLTEISLHECINVDFRSLLHGNTNLLEAPKVGEEPAKETGTQLLVIGDPKDLQKHDKLVLRNMNNELMLKKKEMERMMSEIHHSMSLIQDELKQKQKLLYILETYLGLNEEVLQIQEGVPASEDEPLTLFQQVMYMDEEVGIWEDGGLDYKDIEKFDEFVIKHIDKFLYRPKSICAFRVRRNAKDYGDATVNLFQNDANMQTYFLIRNGENLYRIWSNVTITERLFPAADEYEKMMLDDRHGSAESKLKDVQNRHERYFYGVVAIQGLIERTDILGSTLRLSVNLMKNQGLDKIQFIRDGEQAFWLTSGRVGWWEFIKANRKSITQGSRILVTRRIAIYSKEDAWRVAPFRPSDGPSREQIYELDEHITERRPFGHGAPYKIMYVPDDTIYDPRTYKYVERKRRVPCWLYEDEVINFDAMTVDDCDYYQKNRIERKHYLDMLPVLHFMKKVKLEEQAMEKEFIRFITGQLGWGEDRNQEVQEAIDWWKLKNKWKRGLMKDDAKAVRMIVKKLSGKAV